MSDYRRTPEAQASYYQEWINRPGRRERVNELSRKNSRVWMLKKFGISWDKYEEMVRHQEGLCALCRKPETRVRGDRVQELCLDHDHVTGRARELLCSNCNTLLGRVGDDVDRLHQLIDYIEKHRDAHTKKRLS